MLLIPITENAAVYDFTVDYYKHDTWGALQIVGVLDSEVVTLEQPTVENPDIHNDAHWTPIFIEGSAWTLTKTNNLYMVTGKVIARINKPASPGNAFGVSFI